jgi:hypothetical protein
LRIGLGEDDDFVDLLAKVTDEYCTAWKRSDQSYVASKCPRPEFTRNASFNWRPHGSFKLELPALVGQGDPSKWSLVDFVFPIGRHYEMDVEPFILLSEEGDEITGDVYFPLNRFSFGTMERFARNLLVFMRALVKDPSPRAKDVALCG